MTTEQINQAIQMHQAGITWALVARYFKLDPTTLRKYIKHYETTNQGLHETA